MKTTLQKWGNSQGIRIPKYILDSVNWKENEQVVLNAEEGKLIIEKCHRRKSIEELFDGYDGEYKPVDIDWGKPVGKEIW